MDHPIFGEILEGPYEDQWTGHVRIDFFADYNIVEDGEAGHPEQAGGQATPEDQSPRGTFGLTLIGCGPDRPSRRQEKAFADFLENQDRICNRVVDAIYDFYRCNWGYWGLAAPPGQDDVHEVEAGIPDLRPRDGLKKLIALHTLSVVDFPDNTAGVLGFCFGCIWDPEHGLGVLVRDGEVIELGENDLTWRDSGGEWDDRPEAATAEKIQVQYGFAAVKRLGGRVKDEHGEAEIDLTHNDRVQDADLAALRYFPNPCHLQLASPRITDGVFEVLQAFENLRVLALSRAGITDAGMKKLLRFKHLKSLYLSGTRVTDAGLEELRRLPALSGLHLGETAVTDEGMKEIGALTGLKYLDLSGTRITDAGVRELSGLRSLLSLDLRDTSVTDAALTTVKELPALCYLTLSHANFTDRGLEQLRDLSGLRSLKLYSTAPDTRIGALQQAIQGLQVVR
jgi:Leucine Rich repeat